MEKISIILTFKTLVMIKGRNVPLYNCLEIINLWGGDLCRQNFRDSGYLLNRKAI